MIGDPDIYQAARLVIDQHGEEAGDFATGRAVDLLNDGDADGAMVWRRIREAIEELQRERQPGAALN